MTETKTPATETDNNENPDTPSDARVILGPLVKYAAMGLVLVGIIITTAVMMDRQLNDIDQEVAELEAELAQANSSQETEMTATAQKPASPEVNTAAHQQAPAVAKPAESTVAAQPQPAASVAENKVDATPAAEEKTAHETTVETPVVTASVVTASVAAHAFAGPIAETNDDFYVQPMDEIIAERNAYLKEKDLEYLESFRASQEKKTGIHA
jgi:predicted lipid-binding transport protein (Tim44 family)